MHGPLQLAVITDDICTREDAEFLTRRGALSPDRILGVETGGCPHTAIRDDASVNLEAVRQLTSRFTALDIIIIESGGASLRVEMARGSRAIIYDAIAAGRVGRGESWRFKELRSEIAIMRGSRPLYISRSRIDPAQLDPAQRGLAENFNYLATVIVADDTRSDWPDLVSEFDDALNAAPGSIGGASALSSGGCVARTMSNTASDLNRIVTELWRIARRRMLKLEPFSTREF